MGAAAENLMTLVTITSGHINRNGPQLAVRCVSNQNRGVPTPVTSPEICVKPVSPVTPESETQSPPAIPIESSAVFSRLD